MMEIEGSTVNALVLGRDAGKVVLGLPKGASETFLLYSPPMIDTIDPKEMMRLNWMIGLLQQAAVHGLKVSIDRPGIVVPWVQEVTLYATVLEKPLALAITKGIVKRIELIPEKGFVTIHGTTELLIGPPPPHRPKAEDHDFLIYATQGAGQVRAEESNRRNRVVGLLRQALADGLEVSVTHADEPDALIVRATLHAKE